MISQNLEILNFKKGVKLEQTFVAERVETLVGEAALLIRNFEQAYGTRVGVVTLFAAFRRD